MNPPPFIWTDFTGNGLGVYALFRRVFDLATEPAAQGIPRLFADTRYRLIVNAVTFHSDLNTAGRRR